MTQQCIGLAQQTIDQEIYRQRLIDYVKANSDKSEQQAIDYLDDNCPEWRNANPPTAVRIEINETGDSDE